jgi:hypothetical protein
MLRRIRAWLGLPGRYYAWGSLACVLVALFVIADQIADRQGFANAELREDVMQRWGAPIQQAGPSVRYVQSGAVFTTLERLALDSQNVRVDARMNYRKRGLVYFSGFEFDFRGDYTLANPADHDIDIVFVFPVQIERRSMLSELTFAVNGEPEALPLAESADRLTWTGRLARGQTASFSIGFKGRGLDLFNYVLDPELPVRNLKLEMHIAGGENYDYAEGVVPATSVATSENGVDLVWQFASLESGFPLGVILPSERSFDSVILTMIRRAWTTFLLFHAVLVVLALHVRRKLTRFEAYLAASGYGFFYVLLPYLAAYMHFYLAYVVSLLLVGGLLQVYLARVLGAGAQRFVAAALGALLVVPTAAVIFQNHTGLIYSLEILLGLAVLMQLSTHPAFREVVGEIEGLLSGKESSHA